MMAQYDSLYDLVRTTLYSGLLILAFLVFLFSSVALSFPPLSSLSLGIPEVEITTTELSDMVAEDPDLQKIGCYSVLVALPAKFAFSKKLKDRVGRNNGGSLEEAGFSTGSVIRIRNNKGGLEGEGTTSNSHTVKANQVCVFCLYEYREGDMLRALPVCNHVFHADCIDLWLSCHTTCPQCRSSLLQPR